MIAVCWQDCTDIGEEIAVAMNKDCHDIGLRKQRIGYHNSWDCWRIKVLVCVRLSNVLVLALLTDVWWKLAVTYCNTIRCHQCGMMLYTHPGRSTACRMPASSTENITEAVDSKCLHSLTLHCKLQQSVC
jgi:hypothetical protein